MMLPMIYEVHPVRYVAYSATPKNHQNHPYAGPYMYDVAARYPPGPARFLLERSVRSHPHLGSRHQASFVPTSSPHSSVLYACGYFG